MTKKVQKQTPKNRKTKITVKKLTVGQKLQDLNRVFPWFKLVVGVMLVVLVILVIWGVVRHGGAENGEGEARGAVEIEVDDRGGEEIRSAVTGAILIEEKPENLATRKPKDKKLIALTFDDGPSAATTSRLLDVLEKKKAKATFFVVGRMMQAAPEIVQREERSGHVVGSHTMGHVDLTRLGVEEIKGDVMAMNGLFGEVLGHNTKLIRPPYGAINDNVRVEVQQPMVIWTIDPEDWKNRDAEAVRKHVVEKAFDGAIVLMHDIYGSTVDAVEGMIDDLRKEGYEFLTVPEMAQARSVVLENGVTYGSFRP